jgi:hypothetical protein
MKKNGLVVFIAVAIASGVFLAGCGDDGPTSPGGGPGTGTPIAAGLYDLLLEQWACGTTDTLSTLLTGIQCSTFSFDELFELDCPVTITNNMFTIDCTTNETDPGCTWTERVQATGTLSGDTWTVNGTVTISNENPAGCATDPPCFNVRVVVTRTGPAPTACNYADVNTVDATVTGGPFAGKTAFEVGGSATGTGGIYSWSIFGSASSKTSDGAPDRVQNFASLNIGLTDIDVSALPATFTVAVVGGGIQALPSGSVSYADQTTAGAYFLSTGGTGSITVNEASAAHIAGTINSLTINGQQYPAGGGAPTSASRTLTGGFFVQGAPGVTGATVSGAGWLGRMLRTRAAEE